MPFFIDTQELQFRLGVARFEFYPMGNSPTPDVDHNRPDFVVLLLNPPQLQIAVPHDAELLETGTPTLVQNLLIYRKIREALPSPAWITLRSNVTNSESPSEVRLKFDYDCSVPESTPENIKLHVQAFYDALLAMGAPYAVGDPLDMREAKSRDQAQYDAIKDGTPRTGARVNGFWTSGRNLEIAEGEYESEDE